MRPLPLDFTLETERLRLRIPHETDLPHVFSASRVPGFTDGMLWSPPERTEALQAPLARAIAAWRGNEHYQFSIDLKENGAFVGRISLRPSSDEIAPEDLAGARFVLDVGYWTHPDRQGHGYMTEALNAVARLAFETMEADALVAFHTLWNEPSRRVMEKVGFRHVRVFPNGFVKNGTACDDALMRLDRADWESFKRTEER